MASQQGKAAHRQLHSYRLETVPRQLSSGSIKLCLMEAPKPHDLAGEDCLCLVYSIHAATQTTRQGSPHDDEALP